MTAFLAEIGRKKSNGWIEWSEPNIKIMKLKNLKYNFIEKHEKPFYEKFFYECEFLYQINRSDCHQQWPHSYSANKTYSASHLNFS